MNPSINPSIKTACICGSGKIFSRCCSQFLDHDQYPPTPEKLMRSRYSAFALGGYGQYLMDSWHPTMTQELTVEQLSQRDTNWVSLQVLSKSQTGDEAEVEFLATFLDADGETQEHHEHSVFHRIHRRWLYVGVNV